MAKIQAKDSTTPLLVQTIGGAIASAAKRAPVYLDLDGTESLDLEIRRQNVAARVREVMADLESTIRAQRMAPTAAPIAVLGSKLVSAGEVYDRVANTYSPGPGFDTLMKALFLEAAAESETTGRTS